MNTRWERRAARLEANRRRMPKDGKDLGKIYADAIRKRAATLKGAIK